MRIIRNKRQFPGLPSNVCNRDIGSTFKRAPIRPDNVAFFCPQFGAVMSGCDGDFILGRLALPFGFAASPAIFAMCTDAIQRVHRITYAKNRSLPGPVGIFIVSSSSTKTSSLNPKSGIYSRKPQMGGVDWLSSFGPESINQPKTDLEGAWGTAGLTLCLDLDTGNEIIAAPAPKIDGAIVLF